MQALLLQQELSSKCSDVDNNLLLSCTINNSSIYTHNMSQSRFKLASFYDAFDAIYASCIDNRSRNFLCNFFHLTSVMVDIVRSLPSEPAIHCARALHERRWVRSRLRVGGAWAYLWLHTCNLLLFVCL